MKKKFLAFMVTLAAVTFVTSCSDDKINNHIASTTYEDANLVLNYSGAPIAGKLVTVDFYAESVNVNILGGVIPGVDFINLGSVSYVGDASNFTFEGTTEIEKSPMEFKGSVKEGVCTIDLTYELSDKSLAGVWYLDYEVIIGDWGMQDWKKYPFNLVWESTSDGIEMSPGYVLPTTSIGVVVSSLVSQMIIAETAGIDLLTDGNIQAMDAEGKIIPVLNTANYTVKDAETIKVLLHISNIIAEATKSEDNSDLLEMIKTGIDVKYKKTEDGKLAFTFVINEQMLQMGSPVLPAMIALLPESFKAMLEPMLPSILDAMAKTTKMEIVLNLGKTQIFMPEAPTKASTSDLLKKALSPYMAK